MRLAIASDDGKTLSMHFGKALGFVIVEIEGKEIKSMNYIQNRVTGHFRGIHGGHGQHGNHSHIIENLKGVDVVISGGMGRRLYEDLVKDGKQVFVTSVKEVVKVIELFIQGKLKSQEQLIH